MCHRKIVGHILYSRLQHDSYTFAHFCLICALQEERKISMIISCNKADCSFYYCTRYAFKSIPKKINDQYKGRILALW